MSTEQQDWLDDRQVRDTNGQNNEQPETPQDIAYQVDADDLVVSKDAFAPENFNEVTLIMQMRLYDLNLALLAAIDPDKAEALVEMHGRGQSFCPPPAFAEYDENN